MARKVADVDTGRATRHLIELLSNAPEERIIRIYTRFLVPRGRGSPIPFGLNSHPRSDDESTLEHY